MISSNSITVLHVDDEPDFADIVATYLQRENEHLTVETATSASEGLERLSENEIDCVVSDYNMPGMDGLVFLEAVRTDYPDLPFILYTGRGSEEIASEAISAGVTDYMQKEANTDQYSVLAQRIQNAVEGVRAEAEATQTQQRSQTILEASPDGIMVSVEGDYVYANPAAVDLFDADTQDDLLGLSILDLIHPDDRADVEAIIESVQADDQTVTRINHTVKTLDGESVPVEVTGRHTTWNGQPAILAIIRDLSHRKTIQHEQDRYRATFEKAFDAMVIADDEGRYTDVNPRACDLFGLPREDLLGRRIEEFAPEDYDFDAAWQQFQESERERGTFPLVRANGEQRTVEFASTPNIVPGEHLSILRDITERTERERRHNAIFNHTYQSTGLLEPDGTLIEVNETALEFGGLDREDVLGKKMWEADWFQHSEDVRYRVREAVERAANGEFVREEIPVQGVPDEVILDFSVRPVTDDQGNVTHLIPEGRDITELKEREREHRETKRRLDLVLEGTKTGIWEWKIGTDEVEWNETLERVVGLEPGAFEGTYEAFAERVHPDDLPQVEEAIERAIETEDQYHMEFRLIHEEGDTIWTEAQGLVIEEEDDPDRMVGLTRDITVRKERDEDLERYKTIIEATGDPVYTLDEDGFFSYVNEAFLDLSSYGEQELLGAHGTKIISEEHFDRGTEVINSLLSSEQDRGTSEMGLVTADGEHIPCETHVALLPSEDEYRGTTGVIRNISDRVEREQRVERERDRLDEFAGVVSHDLLNPLDVAGGRLELAREECDSEHLEGVAKAQYRMELLIDDLLALAREGQQIADEEQVDLSGLIENSWNNVDTTDATLHTDTERTIRADRSRLVQLLENLFRNAVEHGGHDVTVTVGDLADGFYVADDGPGIPKDEREEIFDVGYTTSHDGTGFGLAIVEAIVEAHDWEIRVTAGEAGGSRFEITGVECSAE